MVLGVRLNIEAGRFPAVSALAAHCGTQLTYTDTSLHPHKHLFTARKNLFHCGTICVQRVIQSNITALVSTTTNSLLNCEHSSSLPFNFKQMCIKNVLHPGSTCLYGQVYLAVLSGIPGRMCVCVVMCTRKNMCLWSGILVRTCVCDQVYQEEHGIGG